jgi:hypothetical protein
MFKPLLLVECYLLFFLVIETCELERDRFGNGISHKKGWSLSLFADNLFNEPVSYVQIGTGSTFEFVRTNRPRTIGLNLVYNFK